MNKVSDIVVGDLYEPLPNNPTTDNAKILNINQGIVTYEHVSLVRVILYATVDDFAKMWRVR